MRRKIILIVVILFATILGVKDVCAIDNIEYKPGDLVEVINTTGGESQQFYVISKENNESVHLLSKEKFLDNISYDSLLKIKDIENSNPNFVYLFELEDKIIEQKLSFIQDLATMPFSCDVDMEKYGNGEYGQTVYFNCPGFYNNFIDSFSHGFYNEHGVGIFQKSDDLNYGFMIKQYKLEDEMAVTKKLNYYFWMAVEKQNFNILKKVEEKVETPVTTTTTITTEAPVVNPKTDDINANTFAIILILCSGIVLIAKKKLSKN